MEVVKDAAGYPVDLSAVWTALNANKSNAERRAEQYALWTIPSICPRDTGADNSDEKANVAIGAQLVNSLSNRVVDIMFPSDRPFFALPLTPKARRSILAEMGGDTTKAAKTEMQLKKVSEAYINDAMRTFDLTRYRPVAIEAIKHAIITGGCIMKRHDDGLRSVYGIKDYAAYRDTRGVLMSVILRDSKTYAGLTLEQQTMLRAIHGNTKPPAEVTLYSYFERESANVWKVCQGIDQLVLNETKDTRTDTNVQILDITWTLRRGDNYPRGLVEDSAVTFHNIDVVTLAQLDMIGMLADVKYLVDPASGLDVDELNSSPRGSYHASNGKDPVSAIEFKHRAELETLMRQVELWERQLAQVFLLMSGSTRDAERVTAEEIRAYARELESSFGGLYSKLALSWQQKEAEYLLSTLPPREGMGDMDVAVTTGMESLSREGQMDALRVAIGDLQMLEAVPEEVRAAMDARAFAEFVFTNRGIAGEQFMKTQEQIQAEQQQVMANEASMMAEQSKNNVAEQAAIAGAKQQ